MELEDGRLSIVTVLENPRDGRVIDDTDEALQIEVDRAAPPARPVSWRRSTADQLPGDRTFRGAWVGAEETGIDIDMGKAREIHRARLRELRAPVLAGLDVACMRADETGDADLKLQIAEREAVLRDSRTSRRHTSCRASGGRHGSPRSGTYQIVEPATGAGRGLEGSGEP